MSNRSHKPRSSLLDCEIRDHRLTFMPEDVPPDHRTPYRLTLTASDEGRIFYLRTQNPGNRAFALEEIIEVHESVPCLRLSNAADGDMLLHLFATPEGVTVVPDRATDRPEHGGFVAALPLSSQVEQRLAVSKRTGLGARSGAGCVNSFALEAVE